MMPFTLAMTAWMGMHRRCSQHPYVLILKVPVGRDSGSQLLSMLALTPRQAAHQQPRQEACRCPPAQL